MTYKKVKGFRGGAETSVERIDADGNISSIPFDPANTDYQVYLAWLKEGNNPEPAPEPPPEMTPEQKLAASGLSVEDLRQLLGLNS